MYKLYLVEDDQGIASGIRSLAENWGMEVKVCEDFRNVTSEFAAYQPHLVLMDIGLPFFNGYHWCQEIRQISKTPIVFISSASDNMNIVMAINMGADDFIAKPFDTAVLMAKIQALLRRTYDFGKASPMLSHRGAILDMGSGTLHVNGETVDLTKNEFRILSCLMENKGQTVSREKLMEKLWESDAFVDENTLTVNVNRLRKKLDHAGLTDFIETKFGVGYLIQG